MKVIRAYPPIYTTLVEHFPIKGKSGILYAWGDRIYNPSGISVPEWLLAHESVHGERQSHVFHPTNPALGTEWEKDAILTWWQKYINDPTFRLNEEVPAHQAEWSVIRDMKIPHDTKERYLASMAARLSGPLYGSMISHGEALSLITDKDTRHGPA